MEPFWAIELGQWILEDLMKHKGRAVWLQQRGSSWNSVLGFEGNGSLIGAIQLFCFCPETSWERRKEQSQVCLRSKQFGIENMLFVFETLRKETGFLFSGPSGMRMGKPVWATGISSKRSRAQVQTSPQEWGTGLCDQKCHGKSVHCSQPDAFFVLLVLWFTYKVFGSLTPCRLAAQNAHTSPGCNILFGAIKQLCCFH